MGLGSDAGHRVGVGRARRPRHRSGGASPETGALVREDARFRPWLLLDRSTICGTSARGSRRGTPARASRYRELDGPGALRFLVQRRRRARADARRCCTARRAGSGGTSSTCASSARSACSCCRPRSSIWSRPGRTYFRDLPFDRLHRLQFDLETTGLDPRARPDLHGRGARSDGRDRGARGARRRRRGRGRADPPARRARAARPIPT